jgi:sec-independent protein translocase protein TatC
MNLAEHLEELRRRLGMCLAIFLVAVGISWTQVDHFIAWLRRPVEPWLPRLVFVSPTEPMMAYLTVAMLAGLILAMPWVLWHAWQFVAAGLYGHERKFMKLLIPVSLRSSVTKAIPSCSATAR